MSSQYPYISPDEYADYGIPDASAAQIDTASRIVNTYIGRPEGLLWVPDAFGFPCYMAGMTPDNTISAPAAITAGQNIVINMPGAQFGLQNLGDMVILDRATDGLREACNVSAVTPTSITLQNVQLAHAEGCTIDFGMTIVDELPQPPKRSTVMLTRTPVARIMSGYGRYGYGRRGSQFSGVDVSTNLLAYVAAFGGPPLWTQFDVTDTDVKAATGLMWTPPGLLLAYFSDVRVHYCAGWRYDNVPVDIKQAVATMVRTAIDFPYPASAKMLKYGNATIQRFGATLIDDDTKNMLNAYMVKFVV